MVFSFAHERYEKRKNKAKETGTIGGAVFIILQPILFLITEIIVLCICFRYTYLTNRIPNLFISMISLALVGWLSELTNHIFKNTKLSKI